MVINKTFADMDELFDVIFGSKFPDNFCIVGKYEAARTALKKIIVVDDTVPCNIEISDELWDGYDKEFILTISNNDIFCEKLFNNDRYLYFEKDVVFIMPGCSGECIDYIKSKGCARSVVIVNFSCDTDENVDTGGCNTDSRPCINLNITSMNMDLIRKLLLPWG